MAKHALLSASGAKRWMSCPPSALLEKQFPDQTSDFAAEGTFAHAFGDLMLSRALEQIDGKTYKKSLAALEKDAYYSPGLVEYVDQYVTLALEKVSEARARSRDAVILLEQRLDFSQWVPEGFGTGDVVIIADEIMEIIDLKYGKGVAVSAEDNPQMRLYALGALAQFEYLYDIRKIRMTICQPRLDSISTEELWVNDLVCWAETELKPRAQMAFIGEGEYCAGDHCRFCKAKFTCRARAEANLELAKMDFRDPAVLADDEIGEVLAKAAQLQAWASDIAAYALDQAENHGKKWDGWKLVEGRSTRKYLDEEAVANTLLSGGRTEEDIYTKSLLGITAMEKLLGKKNFGQILGELIIKPAGKPVLVPEADKRPEINSTASAQKDFS